MQHCDYVLYFERDFKCYSIHDPNWDNDYAKKNLPKHTTSINLLSLRMMVTSVEFEYQSAGQ
jgi:hypothetical protein